jgi:hypothetical protein
MTLLGLWHGFVFFAIVDLLGTNVDFGEVYNLIMDRLDGGGSRCGW